MVRVLEADLGGIYLKITEGIQDLGTYINQDVESRLRASCEMFRVDMGDRIGRLKEAQQNMAQGIPNGVSDVDTLLIQNEHRNIQQEELPNQLCTALTNLNGKLERNVGDIIQINNNYMVMEKRMGEKEKILKAEPVKSIDSVAKQCEARLGERFRNQAIVSSGSNGGG